MTFITDESKCSWQSKEMVSLFCDECEQEFELLYKSAKKNEKKNNGKHICSKCKGIPLKPQNQVDYWTKGKRQKISSSLKASKKYQSSILHRDTSGKNNGMYGKKLSDESKKKMSLSRTGKTGSNATAWKGGKSSLTKRVKGIIHRQYHWYESVFRRDGWKCTQCGSSKELDAHHVEPMVGIIKRLCENKCFNSKDVKFEWLIQQPDVIDSELKNGKTLCRSCHKKTHQNWGSHNG